MKLKDFSFRQLLPLFMRRDEFDGALADAVAEPLRVFARECKKLSTFDALDELNDAELDALAEEMNVFWYDKSLDIEKKRVLLTQSDKVFMRLGTKAALLMVVESIFGESSIDEFWEYDGGKPHYFRIRVHNSQNLTAENERKLYKLIELVKRRSQWLDRITTTIVPELRLNIGCACAARISYGLPLVRTWQDNADLAIARAGGSATITNDETMIS